MKAIDNQPKIASMDISLLQHDEETASGSGTPSLVVVGGSNSLLKNGWADKLKEVHPDSGRVLNLSIGAATSAMGLYRLLTCASLPDDPVIIWEYALNEANYFSHRQPAKVLIHQALLHKSPEGQSSPSPRRTYPLASVMGVPSAVKPLSTATLTWNSAT